MSTEVGLDPRRSSGADMEVDAALGRPIRGPEALSGDWTRFWNLAFNIARNDFKLRFFGSVLGYLWQLVRPLLLFGVLYVFFTQVAKVGATGLASEKNYGVQMLASIVLFTFFQEATSRSVRSVLEQEALVRKISFPRLVIPVSIVLVSLFNVCLNLVVVLIFALASGVTPTLGWLEIPLIVLFLALLSTGCAMLLSSLFVYFRDIQPIWEVLLQVLFYASPVIVPVTTVQAKLSPTLLHLYMSNPLAAALEQFRHAVVNGPTPGTNALLGGTIWLLVPIGVVMVIFVVGFVVFNRTAPHVAENL